MIVDRAAFRRLFRVWIAALVALCSVSAGAGFAQSSGNPFVYLNLADQSRSCTGIATRSSSACTGVSDLNDRQMCAGLATSSQDPCRSMTDRNLQLTCYGMAFAPNFPSNCRDITDANLQRFCYAASAYDSALCSGIPDANTRQLCLAMSARTSSQCAAITNVNDRKFCYGVVTHDSSLCPPVFEPTTLELTATVRDFKPDFPDMQYQIATEKGIVESVLGPDDKPVYTTTRPFTITTHGRTLFDQWYRDVAGVNLRTEIPILLTNSQAQPNVYTFDVNDFFPIDGQLFGNFNYAHNYFFTLEMHTEFTYEGGEIFQFRGDDDVWVFVNKRLVIDLGGVHGPIQDQVSLDAVAAQIGLVRGESYDLDFFFAERYCCGSNFRIQTSIVLEQPPGPGEGHTALQYTGDRSGDFHDPASLAAVLLDDSVSPAVPVPDALLTFRLGTLTCKAPTDAQGRASCSVTPQTSSGGQPLKVEFAGDATHKPAQAADTFTVEREQTHLAVTSHPVAPGGGETTVRATLREDGAVPVSGKTVVFQAGALSATATTGADGTVTAKLALPAGDHSLTASFAGDGFYEPSNATQALRALAPQIAAVPQPNVAPAGSSQAVTVEILDGGVSLTGERLGFQVLSGPNAGAAGTCDTVACASDGTGRATFRYTGGLSAGRDTVRAWLDLNRNGVFDAGEAQATAALHWTVRHATEVRLPASLGGDYHDPARLSAVLVDTAAEPDAPIAGALLAFTSPAGSCAGRTDASGQASCYVTPEVEAGSYPLAVSFGGDSRLLPSQAAGTLAVTREQVQLAITSRAVLETGAVVVRAVLREDGSLPVPGRTVTFNAGGSSVTAVTDAEGVATVDLGIAGIAGGEHVLEAGFSGDTFYGPASDRLGQLLVYGRGQFVVWGGNASTLAASLTLGQTYQFWGSQWANQVSKGNFDYAANPSFKGYVDYVFPDTSSWRTRPANSRQPPATVPSYMSVILTTRVTKEGDVESGNIAGTGIVRVLDPAAYVPDPGHPAFGVLLAILPPNPSSSPAGTSPGVPTTVSATAGESFAEVRWTPPADPGSSPITGYVVTVSPGGLRFAVPAGETARIVPGLAFGTAWQFTVVASNRAGAGTPSAPSAPVTLLSVPSAPQAVAAMAGNGTATVTWTAPAADGGSPITGYIVQPLPGGAPVAVGAATTTATLGGLDNGTSYTFLVRAANAFGLGPDSAPSAAVLPASAPEAPSAVVASAGEREATVYWTAPSSNGGSALSGYRIVATSGGPGGLPVTVPGNRTFVRLSGLDNAVSYTFSVTAANAQGDGPASAPSGAVMPYGHPAAPGAIEATRGNGTAQVSWQAPASDNGRSISGYTVTAEPGGLTAAVPAAETSRVVTGLANGTAYTFQVTAINLAGSGPASASSSEVTPATVPDIVIGVQAAGSDATATVTWTPPASDGGSSITGYSVYTYPGGQRMDVGAAAVQATVTGLTNGKIYRFSVRAANALGRGPESIPSNDVIPAGLPGAPTGVLAVFNGAASVQVSWLAPASNGGTAITGYTVTSTPAGTTVTAAAGAGAATVSGLTLGTAYTFRVTAINRVGSGPASQPSNSLIAATFPGAPTNVTAADENQSAYVTWTAPADNGFNAISQYRITTEPFTNTTFVNSGSQTWALVFGLANGTQYKFFVRAVNAVGEGPNSAPSNTVTPAATPGAPVNVAAQVAGDAAVKVTWSAPASNGGSPVTSYTVTSAPGGLTATVDGTVTTATIPGLAVGTTYTFTVKATNRKGTGPASAPSNAVKAAAAPGAPTGVTAVDGDASATVTWTAPAGDGSSPITGYRVVSTPGGISVTASTTTVTVTGLQNGTEYVFTVRASNVLGEGAVSAPSNPVTPATVPGAPTAVAAEVTGNAAALVSWTPPSANGGALITAYIVTSSPGGLTVTADGSAPSATVTGLTVGTAYTFTVAAVNRKGTGPASAASNSIVAEEGPEPPADFLSSLSISPSEVTGGAGAAGTVKLTGPAPVGGLTVSLASGNPAAIVPASVQVAAGASSATFAVTTGTVASVTDITLTASLGSTTRSTVLRVRPLPPSTEPIAEIFSPQDGAEVTTLTEIVGTAVAPDFRNYLLEIAPAGENTFTTIATGTVPVAGGVLGTFDPTMLLNDLYTVRLTVFTVASGSVSTSVAYAVEGGQKVGNFTLSYEDLSVPVSGLPITVIRNYDSRDKSVGDFGYGWTLELRHGSYRNNRKPGLGWEIASAFLPCRQVKETLSHSTVVRLSDAETYRFRLRLTQPAASIGGCFAEAGFEFVDGSMPGATLTILGGTEVFYENDTNEVVDTETLDVFEPNQVRLTTRDGRTFDLELRKGVTRLQDPNGNSLSITAAGIIHSSGQSISFVRDGQGRITRITDPMGKSLNYTYSAAGDLAAVTDRMDQTTTFTYDGNHRVLAIEDPRGIQPIRNEYDADGRLVTIIDADGHRSEIIHDVAARQQATRDRLGNLTLTGYDVRGNVVSRTDALGHTTSFDYDSQDNLLSETDPLGNTTSYTYDGWDNQTRRTDPLGNSVETTYNAFGQVLTRTDATDAVTTNTYDADGNLLTTTDPEGNVTTRTYDASGNLLTVTDGRGARTRYEYDAFGNLTRQVDPLGIATEWTHDANGNRRTETTVRTTGSGTETLVTTFVYDNDGRLVQTTWPDGTVSGSAYDVVGNLVSTVDRLGRETIYTYDAQNRRTATGYPDGTSETVAYDAEGRTVEKTDRADRTTTFTYDPLGRVLSSTGSDGRSVARTYDAAGRLTASRNARGNVATQEYDDAGRVIRTVDALGNETVFGYDGAGNVVSQRNAKGETTRYEYDERYLLVKTVFPDGTDERFTYDEAGNPISAIDQAGRETRHAYDGDGRLVSTTDTLSQTWTFAYDEAGNRIRQTDPNGNVTRWEYDQAGRLVRHVLPLGMAETFVYDGAGRLLRKTDFNGDAVSYEYDEADRLVRKTLPDGSEVLFAYTLTGQVETVTDSRGATSHVYDGSDRLLKVIHPDGAQVSYTYDAAGNRTSVTTPTGTTAYNYDALNRLETVADPAGLVTAYTYDAVGKTASVAYPNGARTVYVYDALDRLVGTETRGPDSTLISSHQYTLEPAGHRVRVVESGGRTVDYTYDDLYRLVAEQISDPTLGNEVLSYTYDAVGNRLTQTDSGGTLTYTYDGNDRLLSAGADVFTYDANGNTLSHNADGILSTYEWDFEDRLIAAQTPAGSLAYEYDADGLRVGRSLNGAVTRFLLDKNRPFAEVLEERDGAGLIQATYVHGNDLISQSRGGELSFYHVDGVGSTRALTDISGSVTDTYTFEAFGEQLGSTGNTVNFHLFTGEQLDADLGLYYLRARHLDTSTGRFVSVDPVEGVAEQPQTLARYAYALNDPIDLTDPSGEFEFSIGSLSVSINIQGNLRSISGIQGRAALQSVRSQLGRLGLRVKDLKKLRNAGEQTHHLIEQRLWRASPKLQRIFRSVDDIPGVNLKPAEHQLFTNAWLRAFPRSNMARHVAEPSLEAIMAAAEEIYAAHPALLKAIYMGLLGL
ncbi:MAG TPA: fibronectin type III domain-containing protein [Thermoanaerobaculia bacterium]|nr:fibronectin type III domain-containing protein [Thermoanaerobaculia bacterium]